jgi:hypothetical protein
MSIESWFESLKRRDLPEDLGVDGKINIRMNLRVTELEDANWISLTQDRDRWWALVNTAMNLLVP